MKASNLCNVCASGGKLVSGAIDKRSCFQNLCLCKALSCEEEEAETDSCVISAVSCDQMWLCCLTCGYTGKLSCCPSPLVFCGQDMQCCCLWGKCHFPCTEAAPFELGCFGFYCINKIKDINAYEAKQAELEDGDQPIEAVIVSRSGAPSTADHMER